MYAVSIVHLSLRPAISISLRLYLWARVRKAFTPRSSRYVLHPCRLAYDWRTTRCPGHRHSSSDVYWRGGGEQVLLRLVKQRRAHGGVLCSTQKTRRQANTRRRGSASAKLLLPTPTPIPTPLDLRVLSDRPCLVPLRRDHTSPATSFDPVIRQSACLGPVRSHRKGGSTAEHQPPLSLFWAISAFICLLNSSLCSLFLASIFYFDF